MSSNTREIGQITMVLILQMLNALTQGFNVRTDKFWTIIEAIFKQIDTSGMEFEVRAAGSV